MDEVPCRASTHFDPSYRQAGEFSQTLNQVQGKKNHRSAFISPPVEKIVMKIKDWL